MITIRGNLKTGEWREIDRRPDPQDVTLDQAAGAIARLIQKGGAKHEALHTGNGAAATT